MQAFDKSVTGRQSVERLGKNLLFLPFFVYKIDTVYKYVYFWAILRCITLFGLSSVTSTQLIVVSPSFL